MKEGLTNGQKKEWARLLYTQHEYTLPEIAGKVVITEAQLREWITEGAWDGVKRSLLAAKEQQLSMLYDTLDAVMRLIKGEPENTRLADLAIKYTAAIKNLETDTSITEIVEVAKKFTRWLSSTDPDLAKIVTLHFDKFIKQRVNDK